MGAPVARFGFNPIESAPRDEDVALLGTSLRCRAAGRSRRRRRRGRGPADGCGFELPMPGSGRLPGRTAATAGQLLGVPRAGYESRQPFLNPIRTLTGRAMGLGFVTVMRREQHHEKDNRRLAGSDFLACNSACVVALERHGPCHCR
jgi:hypothetical protein